MDCIFCRIIAGEVPSRRVYADERAVAFLDVEPWHRGHTLVVPRRHVVDVLDDDDVLADVSSAVAVTGELLRQRLRADGFNVLTNAGEVSGQTVRHAHVHVVPRYADAPGMAGLIAKASTDDLDEVHRILTADR